MAEADMRRIMKTQQTVDQILSAPADWVTLRALALRLLEAGEDQVAVLKIFENARNQLRLAGREADEEVVMDVMDCMVGWCGPDALLPPNRS